ncbi:hypothetical protein DEU56DRAFT_81322 [Suillus clintonianus]|uniref:uncharacterized protein n=1 Tax=Suillus clintonianus TaxID=1904413 RepID=UPI001B8671D8|nr:uncharacterized protein DEU56DRAFT_81322 [Suillus clintonianus]KAG2148799.1 hypothetical protein DEU56DRAFT_81322 [Suillus clintonianus]
MHQALLIPEVLLNIFAHVNPTLDPWLTRNYDKISLGRKSLAALATTCKAFHEPAMDLLWAEVHQLEPLLGCITRLHSTIYSKHPSQWWNPWHDYHSRTWAGLPDLEPLSAHETCQFLRHSARVRSLIIPYHDRLVHFLSAIPIETCLFPRLRSLTWGLSTAKYMDLFLPHTLRKCHLSTVNEGLKYLVTRCSALEHLSIDRFDPLAGDELSLLSDSVRLCKRLVRLSCPSLDWAAWKHLSDLPTLLGVQIDANRSAFLWPLERDIVNLSPFLNLKDLSILLSSPAYVIAVMEHSQFPSLIKFTVRLELPPPAVAEQLFNTLSQCTTSQILEQIDITLDDYEDDYPDPDNDQDPPPPGNILTVIPHLLCFTQLRILQLNIHGSYIRLDNDILLVAMSAWPHIQTLKIKNSSLPPPVTFRGLFTAMRQCPHLNNLDIAIDTENIDIDPNAEPTPHTSLQTLELGSARYWVRNPEAVASIIFTWLPCIDGVDMPNGQMKDVHLHLERLRVAALDAAKAVSYN